MTYGLPPLFTFPMGVSVLGRWEWIPHMSEQENLLHQEKWAILDALEETNDSSLWDALDVISRQLGEQQELTTHERINRLPTIAWFDSCECCGNVQAAWRWAQWGFPIYPTVPNDPGKPCLKAPPGQGGHHLASRDLDEVVAWFNIYPDAGIRAALPAGVVVIDIDRHHDGQDGWQQLDDLTDRLGPLPDTVTILTPSDGLHLVFRIDEDTHQPGVWRQYANGSDAIELQRFNTPLPPSTKTNGPYRLVDLVDSIDDLPLLPMPWVEVFRHRREPIIYAPARQAGTRLQADLLTEIELAGAGERNQTLFTKVCSAIKYQVFDQDMFMDAGRRIGLDDREILSVFRSAHTTKRIDT